MSAVAAPRLALSGHDLYLFREGTHSRLYQKLGAHLVEGATEFAVWAPNAASVAVVGDFNGWTKSGTELTASEVAGVWTITLPLPPGRHQYAFLIDGERWVIDPTATVVHDEFGTETSVVTVSRAGAS